MKRFRLTPRALADLDEIADYSLAAWGPAQTLRYLRDLDKRFAWLAENPLLGTAREELGAGYRCFRQGAHLVFYVIKEDEVIIIGVPHRARDVDAYFSDDDAG
ncbi:MAG: type II toxin-antitoxin system RelE/ParE family toxin [Terricaulis sp.]|nr:type II toxin-antitoxin system RelE/ParE family toxin [Terricaulis sp.]